MPKNTATLFAALLSTVKFQKIWEEIREKFFTNLVFDSIDADDKLEEAMIFMLKMRK